MVKKVLTTAVAALISMSASSAFAVPVGCNTLTSLAQYIAQNPGGGCFVQDKLFTDFSYTGGGATVAADVNVGVIFSSLPGQDIHGFVLSTPTDGVWSTGFTFGYTIAVNPPNPSINISGAEVQINLGVLANPTSAMSTKSNGQSESVVFGNETDSDVFAGVQSLSSSTAVTIPPTGFLISLEETYIETLSPPRVAEPGTMAVLGSGLLGMLAWLRWRRRQL
jgi:opacity protein-like surface antigen